MSTLGPSPAPSAETLGTYRVLMSPAAPDDWDGLRARRLAATRLASRAFFEGDREAWGLVQIVEWRLQRRGSLRPTDPGDVMVLDALYRAEESRLPPAELPRGLDPEAFCALLERSVTEHASSDGELIKAMLGGGLGQDDWKYFGYQWLSSAIDFTRQIAIASLTLPRSQSLLMYHNLYDESGRGDESKSHFNLLRAFLGQFDVEVDNEEAILDWTAPEVLAMANAQNRLLWHPEPGWGLGSMFLSERLVPSELGKVREALLSTMTLAAGSTAFFDEHVVLDQQHGAEWLGLIRDLIVDYDDQRVTFSAAVQRGRWQKRAWDAAYEGWQTYKRTGTPPGLPARALREATGLLADRVRWRRDREPLRMMTTFRRLCPAPAGEAPPLGAIARYLATPEARAALATLEGPDADLGPPLEALRSRGLASLFAEPFCTAYHLADLNALLAGASGSLAITVGVNGLALLPVYLGADGPLLERVLDRVRAGASASLLLTELAHGSDLLGNETRAEPGVAGADGSFRPLAASEGPPSHYRLYGEKHLINGGRRHELLVCLARTRPPTSAGAPARPRDLSVFVVERDASIEPLPRYETLPCAGADISGVRFRGTLVDASALVGREGQGFELIQSTLAISRGGVSALAAGAASRARELALSYARKRSLYGRPIAGLGAVAEHLANLCALDALASALAVRQAALVNAFGPGAVCATSAAKYAGCLFAEEAVTEGRRVLAARALLREGEYERLVRDVLLYGVFDGTSHVMLEQLQWRLTQLAALPDEGADTAAAMRSIYALPPLPLIELRGRREAHLVRPDLHLRALDALPGTEPLGPLAAVASALLSRVLRLRESDEWGEDQSLRFAAAARFAELEALIALAELADPARRAALGLPPAGGSAEERTLDAATYAYALPWLGARVAAGVRRLAPGPDGADLASLEDNLSRRALAARRSLAARLAGPAP